MFMFPFFNMLAYLVIIGDGLPSVIAPFIHDSPPSRSVVILFVAIFIILPMCLFRYMASLSLTAAFSVSSVVILAFILIIGGPVVAYQERVPLDQGNYTSFNSTFFEGLDVLAFVFVNHHGTSLIFRTMKYPSIMNWRRAISFACRAGILLCSMIGIAGYSLFGKYTQGNILNNFNQQDALISFARAIVAASVILTYPQDCFVARHCILSVIRRQIQHARNTPASNDGVDGGDTTTILLSTNPLHSDSVNCVDDDTIPTPYQRDYTLSSPKDPPIAEIPLDQLSDAWHLSVTLALWLLTVVVAVCSTDLGVVNTLNGALAGSFIGFILPAAFYLKSHEVEIRDALSNIFASSHSTFAIVHVLLFQHTTAVFCVYSIVAGLLCSIIGLFSVIVSFLKS